jgi:hypothetical protein
MEIACMQTSNILPLGIQEHSNALITVSYFMNLCGSLTFDLPMIIQQNSSQLSFGKSITSYPWVNHCQKSSMIVFILRARLLYHL